MRRRDAFDTRGQDALDTRSDANTPFPPDAQQPEGQRNIRLIRSGSYRIAYTVGRKILCVLVLRVGDRKESYRHFNR